MVAGAGEAVRKGCNGWLATPVRGVADCAGVGDSAAATPREPVFAGVVSVWARFGFVGPFTAIARSTLGDGDASDPTRSGRDLLSVDAVSWLPPRDQAVQSVVQHREFAFAEWTANLP